MILELRDIKKSYSSNRNEVSNILTGVTLSVEEGKVSALIGGNGVGKTALFNIISGFETDYSGEIIFDGKVITHLPAYKVASYTGIGRLFQGRQMFEDMTLLDNMLVAVDDVEFGWFSLPQWLSAKRSLRRNAAVEKRAADLLVKLFGEQNKFIHAMDSKASAFSYGEQRLLALSRLCMRQSKLLLLDEPTSGVNLMYIDSMAHLIRNMVEIEHRSVLLIEHNMAFVRSVADHCYYLSDGKIMKEGSPDEVLDDERVRKDYMGDE